MWIKIDDDTGGGSSMTGHTLLFMECDFDEADLAFKAWTGQDPSASTPEYGAIISMREVDSPQDGSAFQRACDYDTAKRKWIEAPRPGYYLPYVPFEEWMAQQLINPSPEAMRKNAWGANSSRYDQAAIATFPFLGSLLLPRWVAALQGEANGIANPAQRINLWAPSLIELCERSALSPSGPADRQETLRILEQAASGLNLARALARDQEQESDPADLDSLATSLDSGFETLLSAMGPFHDKQERLNLGSLLCQTQLPLGFGAFLNEHRAAISQSDAAALLASAQSVGFSEGERLLRESLTQPARSEPRKPKNL